MKALAAVVVGLALTTTAPATVGSPSAAAGGLNRAGIVVDAGDGSGIHTACVWFEERSITGLDLLARSSFDVGVRAFGGMGGAVCSIDGTGCGTDSSCLTCGGSSYWGYSFADPGDTRFTSTPVGAVSRTVVDGSVDGWRWGNGAAPRFRSIDQVCPSSPPPVSTDSRPPAPRPTPPGPTAPRPAPIQPPPDPGPTGPPGRAPIPSSRPAPPNDAPVATSAPSPPTSMGTDTTSTTAESVDTTVPRSVPSSAVIDPPESDETMVAAASMESGRGDAGGGGGVLTVVALVLGVAMLAAAAWWARRT